MEITNEVRQSFGVYCGKKTVETVAVTGDYAVITFHSVRNYRGWTGFRIFFRIQENGSKPETIGTIVFNPRHQIRLP